MIYDCFIFSNELDLLEIRLHELDKIVDRFVLVEATETFSGTSKQLYFSKNKSRFAKFLPKIIHVVVDDLSTAPDAHTLSYFTNYPFQQGSYQAWSREIYQRNAIMRGLTQCKKSDQILISDVDEIPRATQVARLKPSKHVLVFEQSHYFYYLNCESADKWRGTRAVAYDPSLIPEVVRNTSGKNIRNGGWHFSFLGKPIDMIKKIRSYSHQEHNTKKNLDIARIKFNVDNALDLFERPFQYSYVPLDSSYPSYIRSHLGRFHSFIHPMSKIDVNTRRLRGEIFRLRSLIYWNQLELDQVKKALANYQKKYRRAIRYNPLYYIYEKIFHTD